MNIFITLFAIRKDSWTALVWKRQSLMCLYMQLNVFCIQQASIDFKLNTYFAWLYNVGKFRSVHSLRERLLAASQMPRRSRISLDHSERIVRGFEDQEEDYLVVADALGVNRSTARGIVARYIWEGRIQDGPRDGRNNVRVNDEIRDCLEEIINENCLLTLCRINSELRRRLP